MASDLITTDLTWKVDLSHAGLDESQRASLIDAIYDEFDRHGVVAQIRVIAETVEYR